MLILGTNLLAALAPARDRGINLPHDIYILCMSCLAMAILLLLFVSLLFDDLQLWGADPRWGDVVDQSVDVLVLSSGSRWNSKVRKTFRSNEEVAYLDWSQAYRFALETTRSFIQVFLFTTVVVTRSHSLNLFLQAQQEQGHEIIDFRPLLKQSFGHSSHYITYKSEAGPSTRTA